MCDNLMGDADGLTSIFLTAKIGPSWINIFGLIIVIFILLPNIIYAVKFQGLENKCKNKAMNIIEQVGRYSSMFLIIFNFGVADLGFSSLEMFAIYFLGNITFMTAYWIIWGMYFKKKNLWKSITLAIVPTAIFLLNGITLRNYLLIISAVIFGIGHVYVTYINVKAV
jgi:hypothetical protein